MHSLCLNLYLIEIKRLFSGIKIDRINKLKTASYFLLKFISIVLEY